LYSHGRAFQERRGAGAPVEFDSILMGDRSFLVRSAGFSPYLSAETQDTG